MPESEEVMLDSHGTVVSAFSRAFARQNSQFEKAIQALVSLNEQISTSLVLSGTEQGTDFQHRPSHQLQDGGSVASRQQQAFDSSVALMRRLLLDAQAKFRRMVEENKELAARIDGDIQQAQEEVAVLRGELADTSRRLDQHLIAANTHLNNASSSSASSTSATAGGGVRKKQLHSVSARNLERASKMPVNSTSITSSAAPAGAATPRSTTATPSSCSAVKSTAGGASRSSSPPQPPSYRPKGSTSGGMSDSGNSGVKSSATGNVRDNDEMEDDVANVSAGNGDKNLAEVEGDGQNGRNASYSGGEGQQDEPVFRPPSPIAGTGSQPDGVVEPTSSSASSRPKNKPSANNCDNNPAATMRLRLENERLQSEVEQLRKLVGGGISDLEGASAVVDFDDPLRIQALEIELQHAKEALAVLKADRKRLKAEKYDLLNQMKELYATLDDKEKELRDFIRNYDKIREQDSSMQQLSTEREERERERWSLLRHARDEAERSLSLAAQLEMKEQQLQQLQEQLQEARRQLAGQGSGGGCLSDQESLASMSISVSRVNGSSCGLTTPTCGLPGHPGLLSGHHGYNSVGLLPGDRGSCSADSGVRGSSDRESGGATSGGGNLSDSTTDGTPTMTLGGSNIEMDSISVLSSITAPHIYQSATTPKDCSPSLSPLNANTFSKSMDSSVLSRSVEQLSNPLELEVRRGIKNPQHLPPPPPVVSQQQGRSGSRGGTWGSISRVFARSRHRKVASPSSQEGKSPSMSRRAGCSVTRRDGMCTTDTRTGGWGSRHLHNRSPESHSSYEMSSNGRMGRGSRWFDREPGRRRTLDEGRASRGYGETGKEAAERHGAYEMTAEQARQGVQQYIKDIERLGASDASTERIGLVMQQYSKDLERQGTYENVAEITGEDIWHYSGESDPDKDEGGIYENIAEIRAGNSYSSDRELNKSTGIYDTPADILAHEEGDKGEKHVETYEPTSSMAGMRSASMQQYEKEINRRVGSERVGGMRQYISSCVCMGRGAESGEF